MLISFYVLSFMFYVLIVWMPRQFVSYEATFGTQFTAVFCIIYNHLCNVFICWKQINEMKYKKKFKKKREKNKQRLEHICLLSLTYHSSE